MWVAIDPTLDSLETFYNTSLLDLDSEVLSLTVEVTGALPTTAALDLLHPVERVAVQTWVGRSTLPHYRGI